MNDLISTEGAMASQAHDDEHLVSMWLHGRSQHTQRAYRADADRFLGFIGKPLPMVTVSDVQGFQDCLTEMSPNSVARTLSAVKSLLTFGQRVGYLRFNVGAVVRLPKVKNLLAERILSQDEVIRMIALEPNRRDRAVLEVLYFTGCRISELVGLRWRDFKQNGVTGQLTFFGKGGKTRTVILHPRVFKSLTQLKGRRHRLKCANLCESEEESPVEGTRSRHRQGSSRSGGTRA